MGSASDGPMDANARVRQAQEIFQKFDWLIDTGFWLVLFGLLFSFGTGWALIAVPVGIAVACVPYFLSWKANSGGQSERLL